MTPTHAETLNLLRRNLSMAKDFDSFRTVIPTDELLAALEAGATALRQGSGPLHELIERWRKNADMLAEGNKAEGGSEAAGMQRACADQLAEALACDLDSESLGRWRHRSVSRCGCALTTYERGVDQVWCEEHAK